MKAKLLVTKPGIQRGEVMEVRLIPFFLGEAFQCIEGPHMGQIFQLQDVIEIDETSASDEMTQLKQENLQRLEEVKGLQGKVESLTEYSKKTAKHLRKVREDLSKAWTSNNAEREARILLEATLEQAMLDHQPVVLPREVAAELDYLLKSWSAMGVAKLIANKEGYNTTTHCLAWIYNDSDKKASERRDMIMKALVNGYTVEEPKTPEDKVLNYYNTITPKDWKYAGDGNDPVYIERNAIRTTCYLLGKTIDGVNSK